MVTIDALRNGELAGAREIYLSSCNLAEFPREIFGLAETLEVLDLSGNMLRELPEDFDRLTNLRALFCSNNHFDFLPPVLGNCTALTQIGFRGTGLREVPAEALPPHVRWLTLTDNLLTSLPDALGDRLALQKLMLAGNCLKTLPKGLAQATSLELLRISANDLEELPSWLGRLPRLSWLAWAGNPLQTNSMPSAVTEVSWADLCVQELLGEGASGRIYRALWQPPGDHVSKPIAIKLFKGTMTSDGLPECEMAACLTAGEHVNLVGGSGRLINHPDGAEGLLMPLMDPNWQILARPPSLETCSRDVYPSSFRLGFEHVCRISNDVGAAVAHLHAQGLSHGDIYAHNILWDGTNGEAVLSDFGAASFLPSQDEDALKRLEVRAWGILLGELLDRCDGDGPQISKARDLQTSCVQPDQASRPSMVDALDALRAFR